MFGFHGDPKSSTPILTRREWLRISGLGGLGVCVSPDCSAGAANKPLVIALWPGKVPGDDAAKIGEEKFFEMQRNGKPYEVAGRPAKWLTNVTKPTLTIYRPAKDKDTGVAMLICPGGGYHNLLWDVHGEEVAEWLNSIGVTGIILKYRVPRRPGEDKRQPAPGPLKDAQRAVSLVRSQAKDWGLDPKRIGMVGFSAGGHLVAATATNFDKRAYEPIDDIDKVNCRPDFGVMLYSGYLKLTDKDELAPDLRVSAQTPPIMLVHASDDPVSHVDNSVVMYLALKRAGVSTEMHLYATGGHPFGVRKRDLPCSTWTERCADWLRNEKILKRSVDSK
jgi:acetyl esterase/lipase